MNTMARERTHILRGATALILLVAVAGGAVVAGVTLERRADAVAERDAAIDAARTEVLALITVSAQTSDADVTRILAGATQDFRKRFSAQVDTFRSVLMASKVKSSGRVMAAGVATYDGNTANILVATTGSVQNKATESPVARNYRLNVAVQKVGDRWLVSGIDFAP